MKENIEWISDQLGGAFPAIMAIALASSFIGILELILLLTN